MKILLLSAYDAPSHKRWRQALVQHLPEHNWISLSLPPRHFSWRVRGNSLTWSMREELHEDYDLLIATSMTDLSSLRGMVPGISTLPTILYFHENQFAYPDNRIESRSIEPAVLNLYSAICADRIVFNSEFNRSTFFHGTELFLNKMPDHVPGGIVDQLANKASVLPVPLEAHCYVPGEQHSPLTLLWNHRWEYDKGPGRLLDICRRLVGRRVDFKLNILGQAFRETPAEIHELISFLGDHLGQVGFIEKESDYRSCLASSHMVLSTALHEFQGLSVLEGMAAGCYPVVPDRLCYPEFIDVEYRYPSSAGISEGEDYEAEINGAVELIMRLHQHPPPKSFTAIEALGWERLVGRYQDLIKDVYAAGMQ